MKRLFAGIATVLVCLAILIPVALAASVSISGPNSVEAGDTITITISGTGEGVNGHVSVQGLQFVGTSSQLSSSSEFVLLPDYGTASVNYTYKVTAASGHASVTLSGVEAAVDDEVVAIAGASWAAPVVPPPTDPPTTPPTDPPTAPPTDSPTEPPTTPPTDPPTNPPTETPVPSGDATPNPTQTRTKQPVKAATTRKPPTPEPTRDSAPKMADGSVNYWLFAVIPAGCAAIAMVASKKAFVRRR